MGDSGKQKARSLRHSQLPSHSTHPKLQVGRHKQEAKMMMLKPNATFKEFAEDNYCKQSIRVAESFILKNTKNIIWVNKDKHTVDEMQKLLRVNCLHKGDFGSCKGKKWMVAVDGSNSSYLALEETLKLADPVKDHVFVITVREKTKVSKRAKTLEADVRLNFEMWKAARDIATSCDDRMKESEYEYTVLFPDAYDARRMLVNLCHRFKVDYLCIGKHKKGERKTRPFTFKKSMTVYANKKALCQVLLF